MFPLTEFKWIFINTWHQRDVSHLDKKGGIKICVRLWKKENLLFSSLFRSDQFLPHFEKKPVPVGINVVYRILQNSVWIQLFWTDTVFSYWLHKSELTKLSSECLYGIHPLPPTFSWELTVLPRERVISDIL